MASRLNMMAMKPEPHICGAVYDRGLAKLMAGCIIVVAATYCRLSDWCDFGALWVTLECLAETFPFCIASAHSLNQSQRGGKA